MSDDVNRIRNPKFQKGKRAPQSWEWHGGDNATWQRQSSDDSYTGMSIQTDRKNTVAFFSQKMRCKAEHWYRFETDVSASFVGSDRHSGANLWVRPVIDDQPADDHVRLAGTLCTSDVLTLRGSFKTPPGTRAIIIEVGLSDATGRMTIHDVFATELIEPDQACHPMALPPPSRTLPAPRKIKRLAICSDDDSFAPLSSILSKRFGPKFTTTTDRKNWRAEESNVDALIFPDEKPPTGIRSLKSLLDLASRQAVVISTSAFTAIVGDGLKVRTIEQDDDPLCAKIAWGDYMTRGFALHDVFPFAHRGEQPRSQVQRHFRKGPALTKLLRQHGFVAVLESMTDSESTSDVPMCLYKSIPGGGLTVIDMEPMAESPTSADEPNIAVYLLLNILGVEQTGLGQYVSPLESEQEWHELLRDFTPRYYVFKHHGKTRENTVIQVGEDDETIGLPMMRRQAILIRTGIRGDDFAGIYGTMFFLKHLVRLDPPNETPYAHALTGKFRLVWIPLCNPWQPSGWQESLADEQVFEGDFDPGELSTIIDITDSDTQRLRVLYDHRDDDFDRQADMIRGLAGKFSSGRFFCRQGSDDTPVTRHDDRNWRTLAVKPDVMVDTNVFDTPLHASARSAGARLIRIEIPGSNQDLACNSIWRTDMVATTLEHVLGLQYGLIAMNRRGKPIAFGDHPPIKPGQCVIVEKNGTSPKRSMKAG